MPLFSDTIRAALLANGVHAQTGRDDPFPVVKLFTPDGNATWLLSQINPDDPDQAFGLCDLGFGCPELGTVLISDLEALQGPSGQRIEQDTRFKPSKPISAYAAAARRAGCIEA